MVEIQLDGENGIAFLFENLGEKIDYMPSNQIAKVILKSIHQNFTDQGRPAWQPRKEEVRRGDRSYKVDKQYASHDYEHPLLMETGNLYNSIFYEIEKDENGIEIGFDSGMPYANRQNYGYTGPDKLGRTFDHPARQFFVIQDEDTDEIKEILAKHFV
jgi:phage gpG-like protein